jgi:hypothetical protein
VTSCAALARGARLLGRLPRIGKAGYVFTIGVKSGLGRFSTFTRKMPSVAMFCTAHMKS